MGKGVGLTVDGKEIFHPGEDEGRAFVLEQVVETPVDQTEILKEVVFRVVGNPSVSGNHRHAGSAADGAGAKTNLFFKLVILQRLVKAFGNRFQFYFLNVLPRPFQKPDLFLAEGQDIEPFVAAQDRQKGSDVKMVGDDDELVKCLGKTKIAKQIGGEKERQTVALPPPE